jgi:DNA-binding NtrC family response regulator
MSSGAITVTDGADTVDHGARPPVLVLVILWSASQPERAGEVAYFPFGKRRLLGRGDDEPEAFARFVRQMPGDSLTDEAPYDELTGKRLSRTQASVQATPVTLEVKQLGRCPMLVNGVECTQASLEPGHTLYFKGELLLLCVRRPVVLPGLGAALRPAEFGGADAAGVVGESPAAWLLREHLTRAAVRTDHVLVRGETGTGKELAAAAIHKLSARSSGPFVAFNAASFTVTLLASEMFGNLPHYPNQGQPARKGLFGEAQRGTLFFDEIGDIPAEGQAQLLRVLEVGEYTPVGEARPRRADVRLVGATNRDDSVLREDFLNRFLATVTIEPLRERREDIPLLVRDALLRRYRESPDSVGRFIGKGERGRLEPRISARLIDHLVRLPLTGNVRRLHKIVLDLADESPGDTVRMPSEPATDPPEPGAEGRDLTPRTPGTAPSKEEVLAHLDRAHGNVSEAARTLDISRSALNRLLDNYEIKRKKND